jgi:hypothetical protein
MTDLTHVVDMLRAKRVELLNELDAVDQAIAALAGTRIDVAGTPDVTEAPDRAPGASAEVAAEAPADALAKAPPEAPSSAVVSTLVKPKRMLTDSHKHALSIGRRKARVAKDAAKGLVREIPEDSFVPAVGARGPSQPPRLVKRGQ